MLDEKARRAAIAGWERLDGSACPSCGSEGRMAFTDSFLGDDFGLAEGGWYTEWYRCDECGAQVGVSRRFAPAGDVEVTVEER